MSTTINGDTGITFPNASVQSVAVSQATPFSVTASAIGGAEIQLPEATNNGVSYVAFKAPNSLAGITEWTLPAADGTNGQYLQTNGTGQLTFATVPTTSPGGTTGQIQFNNAGVFGGVTTVPVANGGTGAATLTGVVKGNGTSAFTAGTVSLTAEVSGTLPVANGGTGAATLTANNVLLGNGTSALQAVAPGTAGNLLTSNGTTWTSAAAPVSGPVLEFTRQFVTQTTANFTVPTGVTNIRLYACGKGGDVTAGSNFGGGGGGGFGFGTLAVTAGQVINVTISAGVATIVRSGVTHVTANPGSNNSGGSGGAGGSASISGSLTSGGAFSGGTGGSTNGGGGSAGSPLGNGFAGGNGQGGNVSGGGGGGIGGVGSNNQGGGGGAGSSSSNGGGSGVGFLARVIPFTDPLLAGLTGSGGYITSGVGGPGGGGGAGGGLGGFGGGGGGASFNGGAGGALGGGGGGGQSGATSLAGGGAGGGNTSGSTITGGPATVWIFY